VHSEGRHSSSENVGQAPTASRRSFSKLLFNLGVTSFNQARREGIKFSRTRDIWWAPPALKNTDVVFLTSNMHKSIFGRGSRWGSLRCSLRPLVGWWGDIPLYVSSLLDAFGASISAHHTEWGCEGPAIMVSRAPLGLSTGLLRAIWPNDTRAFKMYDVIGSLGINLRLGAGTTGNWSVLACGYFLQAYLYSVSLMGVCYGSHLHLERLVLGLDAFYCTVFTGTRFVWFLIVTCNLLLGQL